jgi:large subunit ribosomal protein L13
MNTSSFGVALKNPSLRRPKWWFVDAEGQRVGRLASQIATLLQGKYKPIYSPSVDVGDFVVLVNADKVEFTGQKWKKKMIRYFSFLGADKLRFLFIFILTYLFI